MKSADVESYTPFKAWFYRVRNAQMADPVSMALQFLNVGMLIINPPVVGGKFVVPSSSTNGEISYTFTQPRSTCDGPKCEQEILRAEKNRNSCLVYEDISIENVDRAAGFKFRPILTSETIKLYSVGNVNGRVFVFRARLRSRCES